MARQMIRDLFYIQIIFSFNKNDVSSKNGDNTQKTPYTKRRKRNEVLLT